MKRVGIVGREYYNLDNQEIIQINDKVRLALAKYEDVVSIGILPTNDLCYCGIDMGNDTISDVDKKKLDDILDICDGFIVPGGSNWYKFDEYVIEYALREDKPLLGICLGFQSICSMFACNRIKFDMTKKIGDNSHHGIASKYMHDNFIIRNSLLGNLLCKDRIPVNSSHYDYIDFDMKDIVISARSVDDNIIEAVEMPGKKFFLGIQWHPEYLMDEYSVKIFDKFVDSME